MKNNSFCIKEDFYNTFSKKNIVLNNYCQLSFRHNGLSVYQSNTESITFNKVRNIKLFPSYLTPTFNNFGHLRIVKIPQKKIVGYSVLIKGNPTIDSLLKAEYKKSFRANILRFVKKFEGCFNANYKMFFEDISKSEYDYLMETLHSMLTRRFNQRNDPNEFLQNWDTYVNTTYNLIKGKKASLFVIYNDLVPVHICVNHHFNKILFVSIPSYDIDYAKFALGNISLYKLLEWSIENKYELMDMSYGYLEYKRRWSNYIYEFDHHIIYQKNNILASIVAVFEIHKLKTKNYLKDKNIDSLIEKIKKYFKKSNSHLEEINYTFENIESFKTDNLKYINSGTDTYVFLKKPINDFLYTHKEHLDSLSVFELKTAKEYLFIGKQNKQKIIIE